MIGSINKLEMHFLTHCLVYNNLDLSIALVVKVFIQAVERLYRELGVRYGATDSVDTFINNFECCIRTKVRKFSEKSFEKLDEYQQPVLRVVVPYNFLPWSTGP